MEHSSVASRKSAMGPHIMAETCSAKKRIGIVLFSGFALPDAASIAEVFQSANGLTAVEPCGTTSYDVILLSAGGGSIASSSSVLVWTEGIEAQRDSGRFHALFVAGGGGVSDALRDEHLIAWLRRAHWRGDLVFPIGEGRALVEAACFGKAADDGIKRFDDRTWETVRTGSGNDSSSASASLFRTAIAVIEDDFGVEIARQIADRVAPSTGSPFRGIVRKNTSAGVSEKIKASAKWLETNGHRPISIEEAAQIVGMSDRNFLRRFKIEMGVTPSEYLLYVRLDMSCRLLVETDLPVDKVARHCGIGSGGRLAKLFRKHLTTTPTEYRMSKQI
ncbi:transcriptional regulator GlxA family with amidase domain [Paraburkholderia sp. BL6669N2]|uniref:GlxA family transcriptional regulator n=1 Tax=Paraburkholderia sp. BL6669N2 TaxID=1938807 RepID=UPI000E22EE8C|nr:helix-turn-helix domain-containing protein [Paraburkholderia sp. BL6669N2]REG45598.1 transcriptional regulator GlxA family with amidase domain [Paraburkholderia sp. BL6669N2]